MADTHIPNPSIIEARRTRARLSRPMERLQVMVLAGGLAALTIIAVTAAMMSALM